MRKITMKDVEYIASRIAQEKLAFDEPIPDFATRYPGKLESCVLTPFQTFDRKPLYPTLIRKAAILFYLMTKNHPFQNGNKRVAVTTLLTFLYFNQKWLKVDNQELYNFAVWVTTSPRQFKDQVIAAIEVFLRDYLVPLRRPPQKG
jgi:death-on-curing family protein